MTVCVRHPNSPPDYRCLGCGKNWCADCAQTFQSGDFNTTLCPECRGQCLPAHLTEAHIAPSSLTVAEDPSAPKKCPPVSDASGEEEASADATEGSSPHAPAAEEIPGDAPSARTAPETMRFPSLAGFWIRPAASFQYALEFPLEGRGRRSLWILGMLALGVLSWWISRLTWLRLDPGAAVGGLSIQLLLYLALIPLCLSLGIKLLQTERRLTDLLLVTFHVHLVMTLVLRMLLLAFPEHVFSAPFQGAVATWLCLEILIFFRGFTKGLDVPGISCVLLTLAVFGTTFYLMI